MLSRGPTSKPWQGVEWIALGVTMPRADGERQNHSDNPNCNTDFGGSIHGL